MKRSATRARAAKEGDRNSVQDDDGLMSVRVKIEKLNASICFRFTPEATFRYALYVRFCQLQTSAPLPQSSDLISLIGEPSLGRAEVP